MYLYYIIAIFIILLDQFTKWLVVKNMDLYEQIPIIENFFYLTSHRNAGAAWGILQGQMYFFYIITFIVIVALIYFLQAYAKTSKLMSVAISFILGGAIGNLIDRVFYKEVVDFFDFIIIGYDYPIFNIADSALVIGVILFLMSSFMEDKKKGRAKHD